jgi:hypothetical protein
MIELEIRALSDRREGLLVEVGRVVVAIGFTLQRQRLIAEQHGVSLTMVVRGLADQQRALESALATHSRIDDLHVDGVRVLTAAQKKKVEEEQAKAEPAPVPADVTVLELPPVTMPATSVSPTIAASLKPPAAPNPAEPDAPSYGANSSEVERILPQLAQEYPRVFPWLLSLEYAVPARSLEPSLWLAGQRTGAWVFKRDYALGARLGLHEALKRIGLPALRAMVDVDHQGTQLTIHQSPLCVRGGHRGCSFFGGYVQGLLGPASLSRKVFVRVLMCRSTGADDCVLELSDQPLSV